MAIPQGRLSTTPQKGLILEPEDRPYYGLIAYEKGPIAVEDTSEGLLYQNWTMNYDANTGNLIATPETTGLPVIVLTAPNLEYFTFTFDQSGRISVAYTNNISSYLYWYDTALGSTTTTDLGATVRNPSISLDDKRASQDTSNDMLLWYLQGALDNSFLYMARQRDRFTVPTVMASGIPKGYLLTVGMADNLRVHLKLSGDSPLPVPDPIEGLTPAQILAIMNNARSTGFLSLYQFPQTTFDAVFGQSIDGGNTTQVITTGQSMSFIASNPGMKFKIEHDPTTAGAVTMLLLFPNGYVGGSVTYLGVELPPEAVLNIQTGYPFVLAVASDTGFAKITKTTL